MSEASTPTRVPHCPVCGGVPKALLALAHQPIYQHPVPVDAQIPGPYHVDLQWVSCKSCAHAWQPEFDQQLLKNIYTSHYYTPAPVGLGVAFRNSFLSVLDSFKISGRAKVLLEVGASDGDVLAELKRKSGARLAYAFEPNQENATMARDRGLTVFERFFGDGDSCELPEQPDLIYARHVIEHVFNFAGFFSAVESIAKPSTDLVLETPSLDFHAVRGSLEPFHIEHIHVFSGSSLSRIAERYGWHLVHQSTTQAGNLIAHFKRHPETDQGGNPAPLIATKLGNLQSAANSYKTRMSQLVSARKFVIWGAGSSGANVMNLIGVEPAYWVDGNPNKFGKRFIGCHSVIVDPQSAFMKIKQDPSGDYVLIIASTFLDEIVPRLNELEWTQATYDLSGAPVSLDPRRVEAGLRDERSTLEISASDIVGTKA
ncbi:MAG: class I SAM-dependent methyltransferase [Betaproteobacteria bacterium]